MNRNISIRNIGIVSLGCAKNLVDTEILMRQLDAGRFTLVFDPETTKDIDSVILNTCGFIGDAKQESIDTILQFSAAKLRGEIKHIYVIGCLSERYHNQLKAEIPEVDAFFGINQMKELLQEIGSSYFRDLTCERILTSPGHYAYLKIAEGCDRTCSFCAIPGIRGPHRSRPLDEILREAEWLISKGVKEIILISQDTTYYGIDTYGKRLLPELVNRIAKISGLGWLRIQYAYPDRFPLQLLDVMAENPKICRYLDIPFQHINDRILKSMRRGVSSTKTRDLIRSIRQKIPDISLRTTFITGYPGETQAEFRELYDFIGEIGFDRLGVFTYSSEEGTPAFQLKDNIPAPLKRSRMQMLMKLQEEISMMKKQTLLGRKVLVLIDRVEGNYFIGRTEADSPEVDEEVLIEPPHNNISIGSFCNVIITGVESHDLFARFE